jgi:hypothetical protein
MTAKKRTPPVPLARPRSRAKGSLRDIAIIHGATDDGAGARVLRFRNGAVSAGELRPVREGKPIGDRELVRLKPLHDELPICAVEVVHPGAASERDANGPARVTTDRYRRNWNAVFGQGRKKPALPN